MTAPTELHSPPGGGVGSVVAAIRRLRCRYADEDQLQAMLAAGLASLGFSVEREVVLAPGDRIDLLVGRVGVEVKVASASSSVARQLRRYAASDRIDALVLVTNRPRHGSLPLALGGKPVHVVVLVGF